MSKPKAPKPLDPNVVAQAQTKQSIDTAVANNAMGMVNQRGPDGSLTYNVVGSVIDPSTGRAIPRYEAVTQLSDAAQQRYDTTNAAEQNMANIAKLLSSRIEQTAGQPISTDGMPELPGSSGYGEQRRRVEDALYSRLNPQLERARAARETDLANRGVRMGSAAYDRAMQSLGQDENDARMQTVIAGGAEQSRLAGLDSATRAQIMQERTQQANEPINRMAALLSQTQVNTPQYQTYTPQGMATTDVAGIQQNAQQSRMDAYKQKLGAYNSTVGSLFGLGSSFITANPFK